MCDVIECVTCEGECIMMMCKEQVGVMCHYGECVKM